jgi:C4-type Zn-finger protein
MKKKLVTLEEVNAFKQHRMLNIPYKNGIECPECEEELSDANDGMALTSYPAQVNILCESCGYTGTRIQ